MKNKTKIIIFLFSLISIIFFYIYLEIYIYQNIERVDKNDKYTLSYKIIKFYDSIDGGFSSLAEYPFDELSRKKVSKCASEALSGGLENANYMMERNDMTQFDSLQEDYFWGIIFMENIKYNSAQNINKKESIERFYHDYYVLQENINLKNRNFLVQKLFEPNLFESIMYADNRMEFWKNYSQGIASPKSLLMISNDVNKIKINAELGNGEDAFYLYNYYKEKNEREALIWLQVAAENGSKISQKTFSEEFKKQNPLIYYYKNKVYNLNDFYQNRYEFWNKVINNEKFVSTSTDCSDIIYHQLPINVN